MKKSIIVVIFTIIVVGVVVIASISLKNNGTATTTDNTLRIGELFDITTMDPAPDGTFLKEKAGVIECLTDESANYTVTPSLATSWEEVNDTTWQFNLRQGVLFQNGEEFNSSTVKFTIDRTVSLNSVAASLLDLNYVEIVNNYTIRIHTTVANPIVPQIMEYSSFGIISPNSTFSGTTCTNPIGTGPFELVSYDTLTHVVTLKKNTNWWGGAVGIDTIVITPITDPNARALAIQSGEEDFTVDIPYSEISIMQKLGLNVTTEITPRVYIDTFNLNQQPFNNVNMRQAILYSLNTTALVEYALDGVGEPAKGIFDPSMPWANTSLLGYQYNPVKATALFAEAGYVSENGKLVNETTGKQLSINIDTQTNRPGCPLLEEAMAGELMAAGISVTYEAEASSVLSTVRAEGYWDMEINTLALTMVGDPQYFLQNVYETKGAYNYGNYSDPRVDALIKQLSTTWNLTARYDLSRKAEGIIYNDAQELPMVDYGICLVMYDYVKGYVYNPTSHDYNTYPGTYISK